MIHCSVPGSLVVPLPAVHLVEEVTAAYDAAASDTALVLIRLLLLHLDRAAAVNRTPGAPQALVAARWGAKAPGGGAGGRWWGMRRPWRLTEAAAGKRCSRKVGWEVSTSSFGLLTFSLDELVLSRQDRDES